MTIVVFMVAGMSSRFGGNPKQMAIVGPNNETLIEYSVNQALTCEFNKIIFITNKKTENLFIEIFGKVYKNTPVVYIQQNYDENERSRPWGTTDALCSILENVDEPIILLNGDDIYGACTFKRGFDLMKIENNNIIGGLKLYKTLPEKGKVNRGIIYVSGNEVLGLKEMLGISKEENPEILNQFGNVNFIGLQLNILMELKKILEKFKFKNKDDKNIECLLPDNLNELIVKDILKMIYFEIEYDVMGITNPGDENIIKNILK